MRVGQPENHLSYHGKIQIDNYDLNFERYIVTESRACSKTRNSKFAMQIRFSIYNQPNVINSNAIVKECFLNIKSDLFSEREDEFIIC